jgi:glycosyltransferase involved in cell wall biosynthesis
MTACSPAIHFISAASYVERGQNSSARRRRHFVMPSRYGEGLPMAMLEAMARRD